MGAMEGTSRGAADAGGHVIGGTSDEIERSGISRVGADGSQGAGRNQRLPAVHLSGHRQQGPC